MRVYDVYAAPEWDPVGGGKNRLLLSKTTAKLKHLK